MSEKLVSSDAFGYSETNAEAIEKALYCLKHGELESVENWLDLLRERITELGSENHVEQPATAPIDEFNGETNSLIRSIMTLLDMDAIGVLKPHGVGRHGRKLLSAAAARLAALPPQDPGPKQPRQLIAQTVAQTDGRAATDVAAEALELAGILGSMVEGSAGDPAIIYEPDYSPADGDVYVARAVVLLKEFARAAFANETEAEGATFQQRVQPWMLACFGAKIAADRVERNHRFLEESLELVQACGCSASEAHQLVDYTFGRPIGEPMQEVGGVMVTLAGLCLANGIDMHNAGDVELRRVWTKVEQIRAKHDAKPKHSPLPIKAATAVVHTDDLAVDRFSAELKDKLRLSREKGRGGWETTDPIELSLMLREHVEKGDPRDVANYCVFLWNLGMPISDAALPMGERAAPMPADDRSADIKAHMQYTSDSGWCLPLSGDVDASAIPAGRIPGDTDDTRAAFHDYDRRVLSRTRTAWQIWRDACAFALSSAPEQTSQGSSPERRSA